MKHVYAIEPSVLDDALEALDDNNVEYELDGNCIIVSDDNDLSLQTSLMSNSIDFDDVTGGYILGDNNNQ